MILYTPRENAHTAGARSELFLASRSAHLSLSFVDEMLFSRAELSRARGSTTNGREAFGFNNRFALHDGIRD